MLQITGKSHRYCDQLNRRALLQVGSLGLAGLTLPDVLRQQTLAAPAGGDQPKKSVILIWMGGGPSHIDMYDLKPTAPLEFRGEFKPIVTNVPGFDVSEHLPLHAGIADKISILRSVTHDDPGHSTASHLLMTGYKGLGGVGDGNMNPSFGSVVAKMQGSRREGVPPYVVLPKEEGYAKAAYLGAAYNPFSPSADPAKPDFRVRNLNLPGAVDAGRLADRHELLAQLDTVRRDLDAQDVAKSLDGFYRDALDLITSRRTLEAFDLNQESQPLRERYGNHTWGQSALLARRLVEAGVTFVTVYMGGWDTHSDNFKSLKTKKLPNYDQAFSALVDDLNVRGLQDQVLVMAFGEFGRTPRIDGGQAGRHHWPGAMSVAVAGGGLKMGQVIGRTDAHAEYPADRALSPLDVMATMYRVAGVDPRHSFLSTAQRPLAILPGGTPIAELIG